MLITAWNILTASEAKIQDGAKLNKALRSIHSIANDATKWTMADDDVVVEEKGGIIDWFLGGGSDLDEIGDGKDLDEDEDETE